MISCPSARCFCLTWCRPEIFDEYTRRQYLAKAPQRNPFGEEEEPKRFVDFDVFLKLKVLVQLSQWTLLNPDRMRERMPEVKENEQTLWVLALCNAESLLANMLLPLAHRGSWLGSRRTLILCPR